MFQSILWEIREIDSSDRMIRKFGIALFILSVLVGIYAWYREWSWWWIVPSAGAVILSGALLLPTVVRLMYYPLAVLGVILGYFISKLILIILFYTFFALVGILTRILRIDLLKKRIRKKENSYWIPHEKMNQGTEQYEQLY